MERFCFVAVKSFHFLSLDCMQTTLRKARIRNFRSVKEGPKVAAAD